MMVTPPRQSHCPTRRHTVEGVLAREGRIAVVVAVIVVVVVM